FTNAPAWRRFDNVDSTTTSSTTMSGQRCRGGTARTLVHAGSPTATARLAGPKPHLLRLPVMDSGSLSNLEPPKGLLKIEDCLDAEGRVVLPEDTTLISLIERNIANVGDLVAYRYLDYSREVDGQALEVTWTQFGARMHAIGARVQQAASRGERVAILAPQGIDY